MPTLPLFDPSRTRPGESHGVRAPGGYETWCFTAQDPSQQARVSICFELGFPSDEYLRRYRRFIRRPTRCAPPTPEQSPGVRVLVFSEGRPTDFITRFPPVPPVAAGKAEMQFQQFHFVFDSDGTIHVEAPGIALLFRPRSSPDRQEAAFKPNGDGRPPQHWVCSSVVYDVQGVIEIGETKKAFAGTGTFDQAFGCEPASSNRPPPGDAFAASRD